jgi:hypothetical protein
VTLVHFVVGLFEVVTHEFERSGLIEIADGKNAFEDRLEPHIGPLFGGHVELKEFIVRFPLKFDEVGDLDDILDS